MYLIPCVFIILPLIYVLDAKGLHPGGSTDLFFLRRVRKDYYDRDIHSHAHMYRYDT